mgnify:CR=1 FL=1
MFAVIKTGGKQYKVDKDDRLTVELLFHCAGSAVTFDQVLMLGPDKGDPIIGSPLIDGAAVTAEIVEHTRGDKIIVFKKKRRHNYRRKRGHRQNLTVVRIVDIHGKGGKATATKASAKPVQDAAGDAAESSVSTKTKPDLLTAPNGTPDDLTKIGGVGPKLAEKMNEAGIYHYSQIASWTAENIAWIDEELVEFKGRIERDDWVGQAKKLISG